MRAPRDDIDTGSSSQHGTDDAKLQELILYISRMSEGDDTFSADKLNKLLFFTDFQAYLQRGRSLTGQEYQALERGPAPKRLVHVRDELQKHRHLALREEGYYGRKHFRPLALRQPDLSLFDREDLEIVDRLIGHFWRVPAARMSDLWHQIPGWELAEEGGTIPYEVALVGSRKPTPEERRRGIDLEPLAKERLARNGE